MKGLFHICETLHSEVLVRNIDDVRGLTNCMALAAYRTDTEMLTDSIMSSHIHKNVASEDPWHFVYSFINSQTKSFNARHSRKGALFDPGTFVQRLDGPYHTQMALSYGLRQGMHHGVVETPFAYPWSTCNRLFARERGASEDMACFKTRSEVSRLLPKNAEYPDGWVADSNGILLRSCFEQIDLVQAWYGTPRSFIFSMMRKTTQEWLNEQNKDNNDIPIISLDLIEKGYGQEDTSMMLKNECSQKYINKGIDDMSLCQIIDNEMLGRFGVSSVYQLQHQQKEKLANELRYDLGVRSEPQISRCLVMKYGR